MSVNAAFLVTRLWEAGGVSAAPRTPCVRQGASAAYGAEPDSAAVGRHEEKRGERAAKTRTALPAFLRKDPFAFLLHFAACRAETLLRSGDWLMDDCLMVVWYGERRGFPSRFLSPEPLSGQPGANKGRMVYLTSFHDEELNQGKIQPPGPPVHLPVKKVFHLVSFLNFSARNSLFSSPDILWRKKSILAIDILYELVRF